MFSERSYLRHVSGYLEDVAVNKSKPTPPKWYLDKREEVTKGSKIISGEGSEESWWRERWLAAYEASWCGSFDSSGPPYDNAGHPVSGKQISDYFFLSKAELLESRALVKRKDAIRFLESEGLDSRMVGSRINRGAYAAVFERKTLEYSGSILYTYAETLALASVDKPLAELKGAGRDNGKVLIETDGPLLSLGLASEEKFKKAFSPMLEGS